MRATLIILAFLAALLVGALFAAPLLVDAEDYRENIQNELSAALGQPVRLEGDIEFRILPTPRLEGAGLVVPGAAAQSPAPLLSARQVEVRLSLGALLSGDLLAERIDLVEPVLTLHTDMAGRSNHPAIAAWLASDGGRDVAVDVLGIRGGVVNYGDKPRGRSFSAADVSGEIQLGGGAPSVSGHLAGVWQSRDVDLNFRFGRGDRRVVFVEFGLDDIAMLRLQGRMTEPSTARIEGQMEADFADLRAFDALSALVPPGDEPVPLQFRANARIADGELVLDGLNGELAGASFGGRISADPGHPPSVEVALAFEKLSGGPLLTALRHWPDSASDAASVLDRLPELGAAVRLDVGLVEIGEGYVRQFTLDARLANGALAIRRMSALLPGGSDVAFSGELRLAAGAYRLDGSTEVVSDNLVSLLEWAGVGVPTAAQGRLRNLSLSSALMVNGDVAQMTGIDLRLDQSRLTGGVAVALVNRPSFSFNLALDQLNADAYAGLFGLPAWRWDALTPDPAAPKLAWLGGFDTNARLRVGRLVVGATVARDITLDAGLLGGTLTLNDLRIGALQGGSLRVSGTVETPEEPRFALSVAAQAPDAGSFLGGLGFNGAGVAARMQDASLEAELEGDFAAATVRAAFGSAIASGRLDGTVSNWLAEPDVDLSLGLKAASAADLQQLAFPRWRTPFTLAGPAVVEGTVAGGAAQLNIDGRVDLMAARFDLAGEIRDGETYELGARLRHGDVVGLMESLWSGYRPPSPTGPALDATGRATGSGERLLLSDLRISAGDDRLEGGAEILWSESPAVVTADIGGGSLDLDRYVPIGVGPEEAAGEPRRWSLSPIDTGWLRDVKLDAVFDLERMVAGGLAFAPVHALARIDSGRLSVEEARAGLGGGEIAGGGSLDGGGVPALRIGLSARDLPVRPALTPLLGSAPDLDGGLTFDARLDGRGVTVFDLVRSLQGGISVTGGALAFDAAAAGGGTVRLDGLSGGFDVEDGVLRTSEPVEASGEDGGRLLGTIDLPRWRMDMEIGGIGDGAEGPDALFVRGALDAPQMGALPR